MNRWIIVVIAMCLLLTLSANGWAQGKQAASIVDELSLQDVEVMVILSDGSEVSGFIRDAIFFEEYSEVKKRYVSTTQTFRIQLFNDKGEPRPAVIKKGEMKNVAWGAITALDVNKVPDKLVLRVFFPNFLSGSITISYDNIDYIELYGFVTARRIEEVAETIKSQIEQSQVLAKAARARLDEHFKAQRDAEQLAHAKGALKKQMNTLTNEEEARQALLVRFPPEDGWNRDRWESVGKEYISTLGFVDPEEDFFYKNFDAWQLAFDEKQAREKPDSEYLLSLYPPKDGWNQEKRDTLWKQVLDGGVLSPSDARFVYEFKTWTKAVTAKMDKCNAWKSKYSPAEWSRSKVSGIQTKIKNQKSVSAEERSFLDDVDEWEASMKWLDENVNLKMEE